MKVYTLLAIYACLTISAYAKVHFEEDFSENWEDRWSVPDKEDIGKWAISTGKHLLGNANDALGLQTTEDARFYAISAQMNEFSNEDTPLIIQYTVKHEQGIDCGGGYLKLGTFDRTTFSGDSSYNIMFGPDICGSTQQTHVIFNYNGRNIEKPNAVPAESDTMSHIYTLILHPDGKYEVHIDQKTVDSGTLEEAWEFLKPKLIPDPAEKKPTDWVDESHIDDPNDTKPEDWVDDAKITNVDAEKPEGWDDESDGQWEAPQIDNPKYKGQWKAKRVKNPLYKGEWEAKKIANPEYEPDDKIGKYSKFDTIGIDIWQVKSGTIFDSILVTDDVEYAKSHSERVWGQLKDEERKSINDEKEKKAAEEKVNEKVEDTESEREEDTESEREEDTETEKDTDKKDEDAA